MTNTGSSTREVGQWLEKPQQTVSGRRFRRFVVRTHVIRPHERLASTLVPLLKDRVGPDDIVLLSEKIVAISEGRAIPLSSIKVGRIALLLSRHVGQLGYGLGLRRPETMQMAIQEAGLCRIGLATVAAVWDRLSGQSGDFYRVAGRRVAAIDGPGPTTIAPYDRYVVLAPRYGEQLAKALSRRLGGTTVAIVDVNDVGSEILAVVGPADPKWIQGLTRDNPMGQGSQATPIAVLTPVPLGSRDLPWRLELPEGASWDPVASWPGIGQMEEAGVWPNCI